jgi:hypothetical protein
MLTSNMELKETYRLAFPDIPNPSYTHVSYGLDLPGACAKHVESTFKCKRPYIIASNSLAKNTDYLRTLQDAMGENLADMDCIKLRTPVDDLLPFMEDMKAK